MKTDKELQLALAKMLPEKISHHTEYENFGSDGTVKNHSFFWKIKTNEEHRMFERDRAIFATEWLHVVWLIEQGLALAELTDFGCELSNITQHKNTRKDPHWGILAHASWQQRATALITVKEMETHNPTPTNR